ncbi:transcription initiation factor IIB [Sarcoptes scabiei]|nr:transcription initiation factor IIB [Sarcoptes scabiei]
MVVIISHESEFLTQKRTLIDSKMRAIDCVENRVSAFSENYQIWRMKFIHKRREARVDCVHLLDSLKLLLSLCNRQMLKLNSWVKRRIKSSLRQKCYILKRNSIFFLAETCPFKILFFYRIKIMKN